jgi:hypothetical protein
LVSVFALAIFIASTEPDLAVADLDEQEECDSDEIDDDACPYVAVELDQPGCREHCFHAHDFSAPRSIVIAPEPRPPKRA